MRKSKEKEKAKVDILFIANFEFKFGIEFNFFPSSPENDKILDPKVEGTEHQTRRAKF